MARKYGRIFTDIWDSERDWRALSSDAQWMYVFLCTQPDMAHDGVLSLRERRWAKAASDMSVKEINRRLEELIDAGYVLVDEDTEELLVRSYIRNDQVYMEPNLMRAALAHLPAVSSSRLRDALYIEIMRVVNENRDDVRVAAGKNPLTQNMKNALSDMVRLLRTRGSLDPGLTREDDQPRNPSPNPSAESSTDPPGGDIQEAIIVDESGSEFGSKSGSPRKGSPNPLGTRYEVLGDRYQVVPTVDVVDNSRLVVKVGRNSDLENQDHDSLFDVHPAGPDPASEPSGGRVIELAHGPTPFERFWAVYPLKVKKSYARNCWDRVVKKTPAKVIIAGAVRYRDDPNRAEAFTAHPSSWLNQGRWDDAPLPARASPGRPSRGEHRTATNLSVVAQLAAEEAAQAHPQITGGPP